MQKVLFIFGTRPEAIKLAPLIKKMQTDKKIFKVFVCVTGQHRQMLDQVLHFFKIIPDFDLNLMKRNQSLSKLSARIISNLEDILFKVKPDLIVVQGDTTTAYMGALASYYQKIKVVYIEDGLRSGEKYAPFPEELNRRMISHLADYHFAPTKQASFNLSNEGIYKNVWVVGNTVIDAMLVGLAIIKKNEKKYIKPFDFLDFSKKIILVTCHRRENFGQPLENICIALKEIAQHNEVQIVFPVHPNPFVNKIVHSILGKVDNIFLVEPLEYPFLIWLMSKSYLIITDSGGIQEEAPSLHKPVLVVRDVTERVEGIEVGTAKLVGTKTKKIVFEAQSLLMDQNKYKIMSTPKNPYGDGLACERILNILQNTCL